MEELQPELEKIRKAAQEAGTDSQKLINELYRISPPIPKKSGTMKPKPDVVKLYDFYLIQTFTKVVNSEAIG